MLRMELLLTLLLPSRGPEGAPSHLRIGEARDGEAPGTGGQAVSCSPLSARRGQLDSDSQGQQGGGCGPGTRCQVSCAHSSLGRGLDTQSNQYFLKELTLNSACFSLTKLTSHVSSLHFPNSPGV